MSGFGRPHRARPVLVNRESGVQIAQAGDHVRNRPQAMKQGEPVPLRCPSAQLLIYGMRSLTPRP